MRLAPIALCVLLSGCPSIPIDGEDLAAVHAQLDLFEGDLEAFASAIEAQDPDLAADIRRVGEAVAVLDLALEAAQGEPDAMRVAVTTAQAVVSKVLREELDKPEPDLRVTGGLVVIQRTLARWEAAL